MNKTQRVTLRPCTWEDWQTGAKLSRLPNPLEFKDYPAPHDSIQWSKETFESNLGHRKYEVSTLVLENESRVIGFVKAFDFSQDHCECGIEIFQPEDYGKGYASEALGLFLTALKAKHTLTSVFGLIHPQNKRSLKLFKKLGFVHQGQSKDGLDPEYIFEKLVYSFSSDKTISSP